MKPIGKTALAILATTFLSASILPALASPDSSGRGGPGAGWHRGFDGPPFGGNWQRFTGRAAFKKFDTNGDGVVTQEDVDTFMTERFETIAGDNDTIDLEQFKAHRTEQSRPKMVRVFQRIDRDGDGQISRQEFDQASSTMFTMLDRDGNGELTRPASGEQRGPGRKTGMRGGPRMHHGGPAGMGGHMAVTELMVRFDTNGDGKITRAEFDEVRTATFDAAAGNSDAIDLDAFSALWADMTNRMMVQAFQRMDADGNLQVTLEEFTAPTEDLVARHDRNGDGVLTRADRKAGKHHNRKGHGPDKARMERKGPPPAESHSDEI